MNELVWWDNEVKSQLFNLRYVDQNCLGVDRQVGGIKWLPSFKGSTDSEETSMSSKNNTSY